jgi:hypothetical protein
MFPRLIILAVHIHWPGLESCIISAYPKNTLPESCKPVCGVSWIVSEAGGIHGDAQRETRQCSMNVECFELLHHIPWPG